ncbi:hypothetical protein [Sanyastnella coralliicola]|uniref:hypothetical protein n=1 Tax=Sanyastnella coralliicola TaxID=3069118 RepID=UPI0027BABD45|nr:hypothetical protein [Longitalea sp. SCSIO 12813]
MKRRDFIRKTGLTAAGALASPYILPSGRLFAPTGSRMNGHVVMVMFAGGVRQQESILQRYLDDSQENEPYPGNIMYNMLNGEEPEEKIVYGTGQGGINPIPQILDQTLQTQGTIFREVSALSAGHYGGLNSLIQGSTVTTQGLKNRPLNPTIFEYLRRHGGYSATDMWFIGNGISNSVPLLNYSGHSDYGAAYGANFFAPSVTFSEVGQEFLGDAKIYHPENELAPMYQLKYFLDNSFEEYAGGLLSLGNTEEEKQNIKGFMDDMFTRTQNGTIAMPPLTDNNDLATVGYACEVIRHFKPALTVVNLNSVDSCHSNFSGYLSSLHRADHAIGHLWNFIQNEVPEIANDTTMIITPECGRNLEPNNILDENDWRAYDHSDLNSLRVWTTMVGPNVPSNLEIGGEGNPVGQVTDTMMTIADILGVKPEVQGAGLVAPGTNSLFDLI